MSAEVWSKITKDGHLTDEVLEEYAFGRLKESASALVEEHFLWCEVCQGSLSRVDREIRAIRSAFARGALAAQRVPFWKKVSTGLKQAAPDALWPAGVTTAVLLLLFSSPGPRPGDPAPVALASFRGDQPVATAVGPAARPLDLTVDASSIPPAVNCRLEVVSETGSSRWNGTVAPRDGKLVARVPRGLEAGVYFVRLYAGESELLREFGLRLE